MIDIDVGVPENRARDAVQVVVYQSIKKCGMRVRCYEGKKNCVVVVERGRVVGESLSLM